MNLTQDLLWQKTDSGISKQVLYNGIVYACGGFSHINSVVVTRGFAAIDPTTDTVLPLRLPAGAPYDVVMEFTILNGIIYAVTTQNAQQVVAFDLTTGLPVPGWGPVVVTGGYQIQVVENNAGFLYIGGQFSSINGLPRPYVAEIDPATAAPTSWNSQINASAVYDIKFGNGAIYVAAGFYSIGFDNRTWVAAFDQTTKALLPFNLLGCAGYFVNNLTVDGNNLYIGGEFSALNNGIARVNLAAVDAITGAVLPSFDAVISGGFLVEVTAVGPSGTLFIGGNFEHVQGQPRMGFAQVNKLTGVPTDVVQDFPVDYFAHIRTILCYNGAVYASISGFYYVPPGWDNDYFKYFLPPPPPAPLPIAPKITFLNRDRQSSPARTTLRWEQVSQDVLQGWTGVIAYNIYRSASKNLEDPTLIFSVTTKDIAGQIDTLFVEQIDGFYKYCVAAVNATGEGEKACAFFTETMQIERFQ